MFYRTWGWVDDENINSTHFNSLRRHMLLEGTWRRSSLRPICVSHSKFLWGFWGLSGRCVRQCVFPLTDFYTLQCCVLWCLHSDTLFLWGLNFQCRCCIISLVSSTQPASAIIMETSVHSTEKVLVFLFLPGTCILWYQMIIDCKVKPL